MASPTNSKPTPMPNVALQSMSDEIHQSYLKNRYSVEDEKQNEDGKEDLEEDETVVKRKYYWSTCGVQFCPGCDVCPVTITPHSPLAPRTEERNEGFLERGEGDDESTVEGKGRRQVSEEERAEWHRECTMPDCKYRRRYMEVEGERMDMEEEVQNTHEEWKFGEIEYRMRRDSGIEVSDGEEVDGDEKERETREGVEDVHKECPLKECRYRLAYERKVVGG